jgi:glucokinase
MCDGNLSGLTAKLVFLGARKGDKLANEVVEQTGVYLGIAVANMINLLNPELIIIGGGVSVAGDMLLRVIRQEAKKRAFKELYRCTKIVKATLSDRAGVFGAVGIAIQTFG